MTKALPLLLLFLLSPVWAELPYAQHGWTKEEAAAHVLSRFSYGARPGEVERVARMGLENWLEKQLAGRLQEPKLQTKLRDLPLAYQLDNKAIAQKYPRPVQIRKMAEEEGIEMKGQRDRRAIRALLESKGLRPPNELYVTLFAQRLVHARHSENGLREVLTDFWFNHFNVAVSNNRAKPFILSYERDVIRPNALGDFRDLLGGTAKHPAMLLYLDNANSSAGKDAVTTADWKMNEAGMNPERQERIKKRLQKRKKGLNENYARELMELHTLGVDGGYSQKDVTEVARAFTGWTTAGRRFNEMNSKRAQMGKMMGVQTDGDFVFAAPLHDAGSKRILGHRFRSGGGLEEGEKILDILSQHPSTANHLAQKLAKRFISDQPSSADVKKIAQTFHRSRGDIKQVMRVIAHSDGFWDKKNRHSKVKSPFELVISANRALDGELYPSRQLYGWMAKMGQPLYNYQAPTGFPDKAEFWVSSATVLNRVNFALQAARGGVPGFTYPAQDKLTVDAAVKNLLPHRDVNKTKKNVQSMMADSKNLVLDRETKFEVRPNLGARGRMIPGMRMRLKPAQQDTATMVGLILGTPEFQRR